MMDSTQPKRKAKPDGAPQSYAPMDKVTWEELKKLRCDIGPELTGGAAGKRMRSKEIARKPHLSFDGVKIGLLLAAQR